MLMLMMWPKGANTTLRSSSCARDHRARIRLQAAATSCLISSPAVLKLQSIYLHSKLKHQNCTPRGGIDESAPRPQAQAKLSGRTTSRSKVNRAGRGRGRELTPRAGCRFRTVSWAGPEPGSRPASTLYCAICCVCACAASQARFFSACGAPRAQPQTGALIPQIKLLNAGIQPFGATEQRSTRPFTRFEDCD